ncbi:CoA-transferase (plasmid) [Rhizobium johnstonii]|nr:CoA-transferase [Rhizobium johnstonii]
MKCLIGGHFGLVQKLTQLAVSGKCEAYNLPLGVMSHLYRENAGGKRWLISKVGLGIFVDPRNGGGKMNSNTTQDLVEMVDFRGEEWLLQCVPIDVVILRGKTADPSATSRWRRRPRRSTTCSSPWPARPAGIVIVQVERIVPAGSLHSRDIKIRGHRSTTSSWPNRKITCRPMRPIITAPSPANSVRRRTAPAPWKT